MQNGYIYSPPLRWAKGSTRFPDSSRYDELTITIGSFYERIFAASDLVLGRTGSKFASRTRGQAEVGEVVNGHGRQP